MLRLTRFGTGTLSVRRYLGTFSRNFNNSFNNRNSRSSPNTPRKDNDLKQTLGRKMANVTHKNINKIGPNEPTRLDEIHFKSKSTQNMDLEQDWKDIQKCSKARKLKVTEREMQQNASRASYKKANENLVNGGGYLGAAVKLAKSSVTQSSIPSNHDIHSKEVEKTHYDEKVNLRKPNVTDTNFNGLGSTYAKQMEAKNVRLDDQHFGVKEGQSKTAVSLADYYKDLVVGGKLANIRVRQHGFNERSFSWYANRETKNQNYSKPSAQNKTVAKRNTGTSSSSGQNSSSKVNNSKTFNFKHRY